MNRAAKWNAWSASVLVACSIAHNVLGQGNVGPSERRLNQAVYKANHNSYSRGLPLNVMVDDYNVWSIELDLYWDSGSQVVKVNHDCEPDNDRTLGSWLSELASAATAPNRVNCIYLEMKDCNWGQLARAAYLAAIEQQVDQGVGQQRCYPAREFVLIDQSAWPSFQELNRRGYRYVVFLDETAVRRIGDTLDHDLFFGVVQPHNPPPAIVPTMALMEVRGGSDYSGTYPFPTPVDDRWMHRFYPTGFCWDTDGPYWEAGVSRGFNLVATDCIEEGHTFDPRTHSPSPVFVNSGAANTPQWGTRAFPFSSVVAGVSRASAMVEVRVHAGTYQVPNGWTINNPCVVSAEAGNVTIRP